MIEELLDKMLDNMRDCITKMNDSNIDLETIKLNVINEWDYFIPYGVYTIWD